MWYCQLVACEGLFNLVTVVPMHDKQRSLSRNSNSSHSEVSRGRRQVQPTSSTPLQVLWRRKGLVAFSIACGLIAGYVYFTYTPETFRAGATIEVVRRQVQTDDENAIEKITDLAPGVAFIEAELTSEPVMQDAVRIGQLTAIEGFPSDPGAVHGLIRRDLAIESPEDASAIDRSIVEVVFECGDPTAAATVVNSVIQAYENFVDQRHRGTIDNVVGFFREGRETVLPKLEQLDQEYTQFRSEAPLEWTTDGQAVNPFRAEASELDERLAGLELELSQLDSQLGLIESTWNAEKDPQYVLKELRYIFEDASKIEEADDLVENSSQAPLAARLLDLRIQRNVLAAQLAAGHPSRLSVEQELSVVEKQVDEQDARNGTSTFRTAKETEQRLKEQSFSILRMYISGLQKKRDLLRDEVDQVNNRLTVIRKKAAELIQFENQNISYQRRIERYQSMLDSYDGQLEMAKVPTLNAGLEVTTLRPAGRGYLVAPSFAKSLLMGAFVGGVLGAGLGFLFDISQRTYHGPDEIAQTLETPILAHLPLFLANKRSGSEATRERDPLDRISPNVAVVHAPQTPMAEGIRSIRTSLLSYGNGQPNYRVVQITSALPGDGKSMISANLACSLANAKRRVVLIDADLRLPVQHKLFGIDAKLGLTSVLNGECSLDEALVETQVKGLFLLPSGPRPNNPAEALQMPEFQQVIDDLRPDFDMVLVDTPPLLAVTDASNVAGHVDGVIVVFRIVRNIKPLSKRALTMLQSLHTNVVGLIINAVGDSSQSASYARAWSEKYGGRPGSEFGHGYRQYGSDKYLEATSESCTTVCGRDDPSNASDQLEKVTAR